jgi:hypothetical protein
LEKVKIINLICRFYMKKLLTKTSLILLFAVAFGISSYAQTNPTPYDLSTGDYTLSQWSSTNLAGTYPTGMMFHANSTSDPGITAAFNKDWTAAYNLTSASRFEGRNADGIGFVNTGSTNSGQGWVGEVVLALKTTNRTQIKVSWTGGFVDIVGTSSRQYAIRMQYRIGSTGSWNDIYDANNNLVEYQNTDYLTMGSSALASAVSFTNILLPSSLENQSLVQIRWVYYQKVSGGGNRPRYRLDDITVASQSLIGTPTKLSVSSVVPVNPMVNIPFSVTLRTTDDNGVPKYVNSNTTVKVSLYYGNGTLSGTMQQTILAGTNSVVFNDLKYSKAEGMQLKFEVVSGDALSYYKEDLYVKDAPTIAKLVDLYPKGFIGVVHHTFSVQTQNANGTPNQYYDNMPISLTLLSGPSALIGTTTQKAVAGVATFNDIIFPVAGTYVLSASVTGMTNPQSVTVVVNNIPKFTDIIVPQYVKGDGSFLPAGNGRMPQYALVKFDGLAENTIYTYTTSNVLPTETTDPTNFGAGNNIYYDYASDSYSYTSASVNLADPMNRSTFKTGPGETSKTIWVNIVPTTNSRFNVGNTLNWLVQLGNEFGEKISRNISVKTSLSERFGTTSTDVTGIYDPNSRLNPKDYLVFYDANGNPLTATIIQDDGATLITPGFPHQSPAYFANLDNVNSAWGTFIPNNLPNGIAKIALFDKNGTQKFVWTDNDAIWAGVDTHNPSQGSQGFAFYTPYVKFLNLSDYSEICNDGNFDFTWDYNGVETVSIEVSLDGGSNWQTIVAGYPASEGHFTWMVQRTTYSGKDLQFRIFSDEHPFVVNVASNVRIFDTPIIDHSTKSDVYCQNSEVTLEVVATGSDLNYQWYRDGVLIPGATLPYLYFASIDYSNTGIYYCIVSGSKNAYGDARCKSVQTDDIVVYVARPTSIAKQPQPFFVNLGGKAYFEVDAAANGLPPNYIFTYQWYANGVAMKDDNRIQGTHSRRLVFNQVQASDLTKQYSCTVSALCGTATTNNIMLGKADVAITTQPKDQRVCEGTDVTLTATIQNDNNYNLAYYWMKGNYRLTDNNKILGANTPTLTILNTDVSDLQNYSLVVDVLDKGYQIYSNAASVYVVTKPVITNQSTNINTVEGAKFSLFVDVNSTTNVQTVKWTKDGVELTDSNSTTLSFNYAELTDAGTYVCTVTNECGVISSKPIIVTVTPKGIQSVEETVAGDVMLSQPAPNPTSNSAQVTFSVPAYTHVNITLTDLYGNTITTLENANYAAGAYDITINANSLKLTSGVYFINLSTKFGVTTQKLIIIQ